MDDHVQVLNRSRYKVMERKCVKGSESKTGLVFSSACNRVEQHRSIESSSLPKVEPAETFQFQTPIPADSIFSEEVPAAAAGAVLNGFGWTSVRGLWSRTRESECYVILKVWKEGNVRNMYFVITGEISYHTLLFRFGVRIYILATRNS